MTDIPDDVPDEFEDTQTRLLWAILTEQTMMRRTLQQLVAEEPADEKSGDTLTCRCGAMFGDESEAHRHARDEHGAPRGAESDLFST